MESIEKWNLAIVGATGQVGQELYAVLTSSGFPNSSIRLLASLDSEGERTEDGACSRKAPRLAWKSRGEQRRRCGGPRGANRASEAN